MIKPTLNTAFNIADLYKEVFGYKPAFVPGISDSGETLPPAQVTASYKKTTNLYGEPLYSQSDLLGQEVFCPVTIEVLGKDYYFPHSVLSFSRSKTIVSTEMTELDGSVDEIISNRNWEIGMKGFSIGQYEQFPDEDLQAIDIVSAYNGTVRLKSALSDIFLHRNDNVLIQKVEIPAKAGVVGVRDYQFQIKESNIFTLYQI